MALTLLSTCASSSSALIISAAQDTWIRESAPDTDYNNDLISVWDGTTTDQRRYGAIMFDLSSTVGVTINSAVLLLNDRDDSRSQTSPIVQEAYILSATPPSPGFDNPYTWNEYINFDQSSEVLLDSLGHYNIAAGDQVDGYEISGQASANDITLIQQVRDNNSNLVAFVLKATSGERDWSDIESDGIPPLLAINWGDFTGDSQVTIADYNIMIDPLNWLQTVPAGTRGDMNNDGVVGLKDFSLFKPIYHAANPGSGALAAVVPEPASFLLLILGTFCAALFGRSWRRMLSGFSVKTVVGALMLALLVSNAAHAIVLDAISDVWIREVAPDTTYDGDLNTVWNSFGSTGQEPGKRRYGVVEFDLSSLNGVQLDYAYLNLWNYSHTYSDQDKAIKQSAVFINTTGGTPASNLTWNVYQNSYAAGAIALEKLGSYDLPAQSPPNAFSGSMAATAADLTLLTNIAGGGGGGNQRLTMVMIANESDGVEYAHTWGDGEFGGMNPQLVINEIPPEPVDLTLQINTTSGAMKLINPGVDPAVNTMFDIDGYVIHSPAGALHPGGFTGLSGAGQTGWQIIAPTATDISELNLNSSTMLSEGDSFSLGIGYTAGAAEDAGLQFLYNMNGGAPILGKVAYVAGLGGDYNGDGKVDSADYVLWRKNDDSPAGYNLWRANFGATAGTGSLEANAAVPEPSAFGMLALLIGVIAVQSRQRNANWRKA